MKQLKIIDSSKIKLPKIYSDSQNLIADLMKQQGTSGRFVLANEIRATHSGSIVNNRVYPGLFMERATKSWVTPMNGGSAPYDKPIMINHDQHDAKSIIGKVKASRYTRLKNGIEFEKDFRNPSTGQDMGSGYILLSGEVVDLDAIQRILDGRYHSVSTGARSKNAYCSICGTDWMTEDHCGHYPGEKYKVHDEEYLCYTVTGMLDYNEVSYIAVPAQPYAITLSAQLKQIADSQESNLEIFLECNDSNPSIMDSLCIIDKKSMNKMSLILEEDQEDKIPDVAVNFTKTSVQVPNGDYAMIVKTSEEANKILDSFMGVTESTDQEAATPTGEVTPSETQDADGSQTEDKKESAPEVSNDFLKEAIDFLRKDRDAIKNELVALKATLKDKETEISDLAKSLGEAKAKSVEMLASELALMRSVSDSTVKTDQFEELVSKLSSRSEDSLKDAITDERPRFLDELKNLKKNNNQKVVHFVENPTILSNDSAPKQTVLKDKTAFMNEEL